LIKILIFDKILIRIASVDRLSAAKAVKYVYQCYSLTGTEQEKCPRIFAIIVFFCKLVFVNFYQCVTLTPSTPAVHNWCCSKGSVPYWSNPQFLFLIWALWRSNELYSLTRI